MTVQEPATGVESPWTRTFPPSVHRYDVEEYRLAEAVADVMGVQSLDLLGVGANYGRFSQATDQSTVFHRRFYDAFPRLEQLYRRFVREVALAIVGEPACFQRVPTFRVHLPGNVAVGEFHTDGDYNHAEGEVNFWVPLTKASDTNTVWIERSLGSHDYAPAPPLGPGEVLVFDAVRWSHGNVANQTGATRASFDFRCIPLSCYRPAKGRTVHTGKRLVIGDYFDV